MGIAWLEGTSTNGKSSIPFYTRVVAFILQLSNLCGGFEELLALVLFLSGVGFGIRSRFTTTSLSNNQHVKVRRSIIRSPMTVCLVAAAIVFRARPRAIQWSLSASDYYTLSVPIHVKNNGGKDHQDINIKNIQNSKQLLSPSPPLRNELQTQGKFFRDALNRVTILRGVNLGGNSKLPTLPYSGETFREKNTLHVDPKKISFVGRPFELKNANEHFGRLAAWGFTFLRLQITWEAVEHEGPGIYDQDYLMYLKKLCRIANTYGIKIFIDPHQDVWSRFTGGSGAPQWTLEKVGFNVTNLHDSGAAFVHQEWVSNGNNNRNNHGNNNGNNGNNGNNEKGSTKSRNKNNDDNELPGQVWGHNYARAASATMFTLFFGGRDFAPNLIIDGVNVQDYLQNAYCRAMSEVAQVLKNEKNVVGFDTLNEPNNGYIGYDNINDIHIPVPFLWDMVPFSMMAMAAGFEYQDVAFYPTPAT